MKIEILARWPAGPTGGAAAPANSTTSFLETNTVFSIPFLCRK